VAVSRSSAASTLIGKAPILVGDLLCAQHMDVAVDGGSSNASTSIGEAPVLVAGLLCAAHVVISSFSIHERRGGDLVCPEYNVLLIVESYSHFINSLH
jgi:hypothetical protein